MTDSELLSQDSKEIACVTRAWPAMLSQVLGGSFAAVALFGFLWMNFTGSSGHVAAFALVSVVTLAVARWKGGSILAELSGIRCLLPTASPTVWLSSAVVLGLALRILVMMLFPAIPMHNWNLDHVRYWDLAHKLVDGADYDEPEGRAYWPPGLPLAVAALLPLFGSASAVLYNIITFVIAQIITFMLGRVLGGWRVGCLAAFFLAVWPNFVFAVTLLNKECLLIVLWPVAAYFYLRAHEVLLDKKAGLFAVFAGASVGYSALTQPSMLLLPICLALFSILITGWRRRTCICVLAATCGFVAVVTPWMVRNYAVFHRFMPITSGAGHFYMVAQPRSDGRFDALGSKEWVALSADEVVRNEQAYSLGIQAVRDHPLHFLSTVLRKPFYLFGQDIKNIYWNFDHQDGKADTPGKHVLIYFISNGFYLAIILIISMWVMTKQYVWDATPALNLLWMFTLYPIFAHSLFEVAERHHYGALPFMAIFAAMALVLAGRHANADFDEIADGAEIMSTG
jgi:hypothetical protein